MGTTRSVPCASFSKPSFKAKTVEREPRVCKRTKALQPIALHPIALQLINWLKESVRAQVALQHSHSTFMHVQRFGGCRFSFQAACGDTRHSILK